MWTTSRTSTAAEHTNAATRNHLSHRPGRPLSLCDPPPTTAPRALALLCAASVLLSVAWFPLWIRYAAKPSKDVLAARELARAVPAGAPLAAYALEDEHLYFKLNRTIVFARSPEELRAFLDAPGPRCLITNAEQAATVRGLTTRPLRQLLAWETQYHPGVLLVAEP